MSRRYALVTLCLLLVLAGWIFSPALFEDQSLVHGDNLHHSYSVLAFQKSLLEEGGSPFWTDLVYGGHALFAENQAGLSNPINMVVALLFSPEFGHNFLHWLSMVAIGVGTFGLAGALGLRPFSASFASLGAAMSGLYIHNNTNMIVLEAAVWIPWTLWSFESWLKRPDVRRAILFGGSTAMMIFSGYPHFLHGTVLYMFFSLSTLPFERSIRADFRAAIRRYLPSGLLAVFFCVGLSAVQWIPLLELAGYSHRKEGAELLIDVPSYMYIRGMMSFASPNTGLVFPLVSSLLICLLASLAPFVRDQTWRFKGHLFATFLLLNLGFANSSPIYMFFREYELIPGISSFRLMFPYFHVAIIGVCLLAGRGLDWLAGNALFAVTGPGQALRRILVASILAVFWVWVIYKMYTPEAPWPHNAVAGASLVALLVLNMAGRHALFPFAVISLLLVEIATVKLEGFAFVDNDVLRKPPKTVEIIRKDGGYRDYKHIHMAGSFLSFQNPRNKNFKKLAQDELSHMIVSTNLLWGIPSFNGAFALKSDRKVLIHDHVRQEVAGEIDKPPGSRLIDILGIKYASMRNPTESKDFKLIYKEREPTRTLLYRNKSVKPKFQAYSKVETVSGAEEAFERLKVLDGETLVLETEDPIPTVGDAQPRLVHTKSTPTLYRLRTESDQPFWLFLADANYPGWRVKIDGEQHKLYSAQVLGKAFFVPAGKHEIKLYFESTSVNAGIAISIATLVILGGLLLWTRRNRSSLRASSSVKPGSAAVVELSR